MNKFLLLLLILCSPAVYGQAVKNERFDLNQLPSAVTHQWKFHVSDDPTWADTAFNDHDWQHIDPTKNQHFLPQVTNAQIVWFRLTVYVSPALRNKAVALIVNQSGAAEIYFNGMLIRRLGHISADNAREEAVRSLREPLTLQLTNASKQYIAIRYSGNRSNLVVGNGTPVIIATFKQVDEAWDSFFYKVDFYTTRSWVSGGFMLLAILQLAIYLFNSERKVNLYLAIYALMQLFTLSDGLMLPMFRGAGWGTFMTVLFNIAAPLDFVFLMAMTYAFFGYIRTTYFNCLAVLSVAVIIIQFIGDNAQNENVLAVFNIFCYLEIIRISIKAIRQKKTGAILLLTGFIISMLFFIAFNAADFIGQQSYLGMCFEVALAFLTPAIILSILLAREFAQNLTSLRQKLAEVQTLSARNLQQEIERQQILARQNEMLELKVTERTTELNSSLINLKAAQAQLIQSEKMASLGELTAGIAHEIQNPLNFVNNFSDVSRELIDELQIELKNGEKEEAIAISEDLKQNIGKIHHHGKRAEVIVKGMLEHSRSSSGQKEPTNLNNLADEFFRLAYHGLRAKDKSFNAELIMHFDENLPPINLIPQDIGRVLLNLFNNAFYSVQQKTKAIGTEFRPIVEVTTIQKGETVEIKVKDNGIGIPDAIRNKIMQPFFTTKPTGEGTGLGLSLSYDIIVKGHGGKLDIQSKEGEFAEFIVSLPIT
ncbi:MAG: ATP-binding protein [Bacteroidota bacterium]|nr:ATP-binding protein [Bacteroidota bacterium]